jgi:hypothetical protein
MFFFCSMTTPTEKQERQERILAELSELGLALARDLQASALAADDVATKSDLGRTFHHVARSVRQTLALEARLERDRQKAEREDRAAAERDRAAHAERRKAQVEIAVKRCVRYAHSGYDAENLLTDFDERLEEDALHDLFAGKDDIDVHIARLCEELGVPPPGCDPQSVAAEAASAASHPPAPMHTPSEAQADASVEWRSSG